MFSMFRKRAAKPLNGRDAGMIRSDTRTLIRVANIAHDAAPGTMGARLAGLGRDLARDQKALAMAQDQLVSSIALAVSREMSVQLILANVITPVLQESVVVSEGARAAVLSAVSRVQHG